MEFKIKNQKKEISLEDIQKIINLITLKEKQFEINLLIYKNLLKYSISDFFLNLNYIINSNKKNNIQYHIYNYLKGETIIKISLFFFKELINKELYHNFEILYQTLIHLFNKNILTLNYFSVINKILIKISLEKIISKENKLKDYLKEIELIINAFIKYKKQINAELINDFIKILKEELFINPIIKFELYKKEFFINLLKINLHQISLNQIINFLIEIYNFRFTPNCISLILEDSITNLSNFHNYLEFLLQLFKYEKNVKINKKIYIKEGIIISQDNAIIVNNFQFNLFNYSIIFSFRIFEFLQNKEINILKIYSNIKGGYYIKIFINLEHKLIFSYIEEKKEIIYETQEIKENEDYLLYFYQKEHIFENSIIVYINGIKFVHEVEISNENDGILELGKNFNGIFGSFLYLDTQLNEEQINDLFDSKYHYNEIFFLDKKKKISNNQDINKGFDSFRKSKYNILLNISNRYFNDIYLQNVFNLGNNVINLLNGNQYFKIIKFKSTFKTFFIYNFGFKFLILQLHNITSVLDINVFQKFLFQILEFINKFIEFNDILLKFPIEINTIFISLMIVIYKTKKEDLKIEFNLNIIQKLIELMNNLNKNKNYILCSLIISILLNKQYYSCNIYIPKLLNTITKCINSSIYISIEQILQFDYLLDGNNYIIFYNLLNKIISCHISKEQCGKIFDHLISNYKNLEKRKYFYFKLLYINIDLFAEYLVELSQKEEYFEYFQFLNDQMMKQINKNYKYSIYNQCLSYLLVQECFNLVLKNEGKNNKMFLTIYDFMQHPTRAFLKTIFIQIFEMIDNKTKLNFIQSKNIPKFNNYLFSSIVNDEVFNHNFGVIIKYYIDYYNNLTEIKSQNLIFLMVNNFIDYLLKNTILQSNKKYNLNGNFFSCDGIKNYYNLYYQKRKNEALELLKGIIHISKLQIYNPFYYKFISENRLYNKELAEFIITESIMEISKIREIKNEIMFKELLYILNLCHYLIVQKKENLSKIIENLISYYLYFLKDKLFIQLFYIYEFKESEQINIKKTILEIIIEILLELCINNKYDEKYNAILKDFLIINHDSIFYFIDQKEFEQKININLLSFYNYSKIIGTKIDYFYTIYALQFLFNLHEIYNNEEKILILIDTIIMQVYDDSIKLINSSLYKKTKKILNDKCKEYIKFLQINKKNKNLFNLFKQKFFENKNNDNSNNSISKNESNDNISNISIKIENINNQKKKLSKKNKRNSFSKLITQNKIELKMKKVKSCPNLLYFKPFYNNKFIEIENYDINSIKYNCDLEQILNYYFYALFPKVKEKLMHFFFYIKQNLLWRNFIFPCKNWVFKNQKFIHLCKQYNSKHKNDELNDINPNIDEKYELLYPNKIKNYIVDNYYKPFIKPDLNFFNNPLLAISHPYFDNNKEKIKNINFKKYIPYEKSDLHYECELKCITGAIYGIINLYENYLFFKDNSLNDKRFLPDVSVKDKFLYIFSSQKNDLIIGKNKDILIYYSSIKEILIRRISFEDIALEFFLENHKSYLFNFLQKENISQFIQQLKLKLKNSKYEITDFDCKSNFKTKKYEKQFLSNKLTNFEYLLFLNKYSTRTYNDINQYLIFPLTHMSLDLQNKRDPSKALCLQKYNNESSYQIYNENFNYLGQHFNIHYSAGGYILYYLLRSNPMTYNSIKFQSGKFDIASRLFYSIKSHLNIYQIQEENRELIPEFFYDYNFLFNLNKNEFGYNEEIENSININNVLVENSKNQIEFIMKERKNLENFNICPWIDNIFGVNQRNKKIINIFPLYSYAEENDSHKILKEKEKEGKKGEALYNAVKNELNFNTIGVTPLQILNKIQEKENLKINYPIIDNRIKENIDSFLEKKDSNYILFSDKKYIYFKFYEKLFLFDYVSSFKFHEFNIGDQIDIIPKENSLCKILIKVKDNLKALLISVRYSDGTIKILSDKDNKIYQWNCIVTSIVSYENSFKNYIIIGDEYGFISLLLFIHEKMLIVIDKKKKSHYSIVRGLLVNYRLDIIISFDNENFISITCINNFVTLYMYKLENKIINIKISDYDILYIQTKNENSDSILSCYTLNGLKSNELIIKKPNKIIDYFLDTINDNVLIGTNDSLRFVECYDPNKILIEINEEEYEMENKEKEIQKKRKISKEIIKKEEKKDEKKEKIKEEEKEEKKENEKDIIKLEEKEQEIKDKKKIIIEEINEEKNEEEKEKNKEKIEEKDKKNMESDNKEINDENKIVKEFEILEQKTNEKEEEKSLEKRKEKIILKHLTYLYKLNSYCYINEKNKIIIKSNKQNKKK